MSEEHYVIRPITFQYWPCDEDICYNCTTLGFFYPDAFGISAIALHPDPSLQEVVYLCGAVDFELSIEDYSLIDDDLLSTDDEEFNAAIQELSTSERLQQAPVALDQITGERWQEIALELFQILDDIDTLADMAKGNAQKFLEAVEGVIPRRWKHIHVEEDGTMKPYPFRKEVSGDTSITEC